MSAEKGKKPLKRIKRRLKSAPTLREQTAQQSAAEKKPSRIKKIINAPFVLIFRVIKAVALFIARSPIGRIAVAVWKSRVFTPIRFIFKLLAKITLLSYFANAFRELRLVVWPNASTTWRLTGAVLMFGIVFGCFIAGIDYILEKGFREVILK